ncbi:hypothetical protein GCM10022393_13650 [Aquimarina addita]|uniref:SGNH/GDSL hydrolase family protein n=1 Tax=Aquimarina addita TaxID=870485 RepID=A0ABP7XF62_9FLAO
MKKLIIKSFLYMSVILLSLEALVRVFYLGKDTPTRFLDEYKVEKWAPNQQGFSVTGNRRQNFSEFKINNSGYNSYREFTPSKNKIEVALVGDSFIEGFHQNYYNSIGKKIENEIPNIEVYEYGYAGYDFADQLHLINAYRDQFDLIDYIVLGIKFSNDLTRSRYNVITDRSALESPFNKLLKKSKLIVYCKSIGILDPPLRLISQVSNLFSPESQSSNSHVNIAIESKKEIEYLKNFKKLVSLYGFDKSKYILILDSNVTNPIFLNYLDTNGYQYIDFFPSFTSTKKPTTLIYDKHWNNYGRTIIAKEISKFLKSKLIDIK